MSRFRSSLLPLLALALPATVGAHDHLAPGSLVSVAVEVEGREAPLYAAVDGSGRFYVEARKGARYALRLSNRSHERLGVAVTVDGLNVISGERSGLGADGIRPPQPRPGAPGRMYILDPWDTTVIRGWRRSLQEIQQFTFVDEQASYAARSGKANSRMGWIEIAVYRERRAYVQREPPRPGRLRDQSAAEGSDKAAQAPPATAPPAAASEPRSADSARAEEHQEARKRDDDLGGRRDSYPGTGWGPSATDPAVVVSFDPQPYPADRVTLRYEYARALRALGLLPRHGRDADRLAEREHGGGFAKPPNW